MRSARSSVDEAPSRSPRPSRVCACATNDCAAGESLISRGGGAGRGAAGGSAGVGEFGEQDGGREISGLGEVRDEVAQPASNKTLSDAMRRLSERYFRTMI